METRGLRWFAALLTWGVVVGCASTEPETRGAPALGIDDYLARSSEAVCAAHLRCSDRWITPVGIDTALCHPTFVARAEQRMIRAVAQGRARFDPDRATAALARLERPDCDALGGIQDVLLTDVRDEAFIGHGALGQDCVKSFECKSARCGEGRCVEPVLRSPGEPLTADVSRGEVCGKRRCAEGLRCIGGGSTPARCFVALGPGQRCEPHQRCPHGFACIDGSCTAMPTVGRPCDPSVSACLEGICEDGRCRPGTEGETCSENGDLAFLEPDSQACAEGLRCDLARLRCAARGS